MIHGDVASHIKWLHTVIHASPRWYVWIHYVLSMASYLTRRVSGKEPQTFVTCLLHHFRWLFLYHHLFTNLISFLRLLESASRLISFEGSKNVHLLRKWYKSKMIRYCWHVTIVTCSAPLRSRAPWPDPRSLLSVPASNMSVRRLAQQRKHRCEWSN